MGLKPKPPVILSSSTPLCSAGCLAFPGLSIANLATDRILPRADRGLFNLPACVQAYLRHKLVKAKAGDVTAHSLMAERSRLTKIKADAAEVEARKLAGELVPAADIEAAWLRWPVQCVRGCW